MKKKREKKREKQNKTNKKRREKKKDVGITYLLLHKHTFNLDFSFFSLLKMTMGSDEYKE